jgi:hypothetical protein
MQDLGTLPVVILHVAHEIDCILGPSDTILGTFSELFQLHLHGILQRLAGISLLLGCHRLLIQHLLASTLRGH